MSFEVTFRPFPAPDGPLQYAKIRWDSETFQHPIYELKCDGADLPAIARHLPGLLETLSAERPVLVWSKVAIDAVELGATLTQCGFYPVECLVELFLSLERFRPVVTRVPAGLALRPATSADLPRLESLARKAFFADRYHVDPHLSKSAADERFANWLQRAIRDGEPVFVYEEAAKENVIGFYHWREEARQPKTVYLSLAAIDAKYQKLGFGFLLYQAVLLDCQARGNTAALTHVSVNNLDVLNVFTRLGCSIRNPVLTLHWYAAR